MGFRLSKNTNKKVKRQWTERTYWQNIQWKTLPRIVKEPLRFNKDSRPNKNWWKIRKYIAEEDIQIASKYIQGTQYQYSSEKSKLKPQFTFTRTAPTLLFRMKKWYSHLGILSWQILIKLNTCLPCEPALPILGIGPKDMNAYVQKKKKKRLIQKSL